MWILRMRLSWLLLIRGEVAGPFSTQDILSTNGEKGSCIINREVFINICSDIVEDLLPFKRFTGSAERTPVLSEAHDILYHGGGGNGPAKNCWNE
jgi:hypothetical protein